MNEIMRKMMKISNNYYIFSQVIVAGVWSTIVVFIITPFHSSNDHHVICK